MHERRAVKRGSLGRWKTWAIRQGVWLASAVALAGLYVIAILKLLFN